MGQFYFGDRSTKWVKIQPALTTINALDGQHTGVYAGAVLRHGMKLGLPVGRSVRETDLA